MKILIKSARIHNPGSPFHDKITDILVQDGLIGSIGSVSGPADRVIEGKELIVSAGWLDLNATFGDPGLEHKEDLETGKAAAAAGGFTGVLLMPNTLPVTQTKDTLRYLTAGNGNSAVTIYPAAAITIDTKGERLTEMLDLHAAGAFAFSDGREPLWHTDILLKSLLYLQKIDGLLIDRPEDKWLNMFGVMNEGYYSTFLGMKGMPAVAEELIVERDLKILEYAGGKLHLSKISAAGSVELIRNAKARELQVTCDVAAHQILLDDSMLTSFDTNYKVNPPLRSKSDQEALISGLKDGTIDAIVSAHQPHDHESKELEFDLAEFGITGLQTVLPLLLKLEKQVPFEVLLEKLTSGPRKILNLSPVELKEGAKAEITIFDRQQEWVFDHRTNFSKAINSPYWQENLTGKVIGVLNGKNSWINPEF